MSGVHVCGLTFRELVRLVANAEKADLGAMNAFDGIEALKALGPAPEDVTVKQRHRDIAAYWWIAAATQGMEGER